MVRRSRDRPDSLPVARLEVSLWLRFTLHAYVCMCYDFQTSMATLVHCLLRVTIASVHSMCNSRHGQLVRDLQFGVWTLGLKSLTLLCVGSALMQTALHNHLLQNGAHQAQNGRRIHRSSRHHLQKFGSDQLDPIQKHAQAQHMQAALDA